MKELIRETIDKEKLTRARQIKEILILRDIR